MVDYDGDCKIKQELQACVKRGRKIIGRGGSRSQKVEQEKQIV
jgi:hypothetical protein